MKHIMFPMALKRNVLNRCATSLHSFGLLLVAVFALAAQPGTAMAAPAGANLTLGIENGLVQESAVEVGTTAQSLADLIGNATGRKVIWEARYSTAAANHGAGGQGFDFMFSKPANLTATLLAKGWHLVAVAKLPIEFGTDFIAQPCPGKSGEALLGGPTLAVLGVQDAPAATCVPVAQIWKSPSAILLTPAKGSLIDKVASKLWLEHASTLPRIVHVEYQNAITGFMQTTRAAVIGAVTPMVSKTWKAEGGVVLAHQALPFWALLAAPGTSPDAVDKVRAALVATGRDSFLNKSLHIDGWENGNPKTYAELLRWLDAKP